MNATIVYKISIRVYLFALIQIRGDKSRCVRVLFFNAPVESNSLAQFETWTGNYFQRCQLGRNHALKGGQSFYEASRWKILFFCGAAIRWPRISLSVQALSVFFFHGIVLCTVRISRRWRTRERERECIMRT